MKKTLITLSLALALAACNNEAPAPTPAAEPAASATPAATPAAPVDMWTRYDEIAAGAQRSDANKARDQYRHPKETLQFFGLANGQNVVEISPGGGWYTELLAPMLKGNGTLTLGIFDPAKIADEGTKGYNQKNNDKLKAKLGGDAANFGEVRFIETSPSEPSFGAPGSADLVVTFRNVHNWTMDGNDAAMFKAFFDVLKPGGTLGVEEHRANPGTDAKTSADTGYLTEEYVIGLATAAGFELVEKSQINANPKDTKDHEKGVWTLPPTLALGDKDKDKYLAIGESDRMTLKFRKPGGDSVAPPAAADGAATGTDTPKGFEAGKQAEGETPAAAETPAG